jgi:ABC-type sugar transport system ATPase subunit
VLPSDHAGSADAVQSRLCCLLQIEAIDKSFPGVRALSGVHFDLRAGEVHALIGENGAGKSTLIRVLAGAHRADAGAIRIDGREMRIASPRDADRAGVSVIYQEFNLVPTLTVRENLLLGREAIFTSAAAERRQALELFARLGVRVDPEALVSELTIAQQQAVEIAKALGRQARIIVMDEPTAALTAQEAEALFRLIADLKARGMGIIYVSHRLDEVFRLTDRVTVLRDGRHVATRPTSGVSRSQLIEMMVGRKLESEFPKRPAPLGPVRLEVRGLRRGSQVKGVSLAIRGGEVLGLTGLVGSGRTELARLIFGADRLDGGEILVDGRPVTIHNPIDAIRHGICLVTEDRKAQGLVLGHSVRENFALPNLGKFSRLGVVSASQERQAFAAYAYALDIKLPSEEEPAGNLSGGNQQKVVLAKWLEADSNVILFDEPTRGIDVGAKHEIYLLINRLAAAGKAVLMISSELPEVLGMSDRILVMHEGRITGEVTDVAAATQERILELAMR